MSIFLPAWPSWASIEASYVDYGVVQTSPQGGPSQRLNRLGNRWALDVSLPPLADADARAWLAALLPAQRLGAICEWPQGGVDCGPLCAPVVAGSPLGTALPIRQSVANYAFPRGRFLSVIHSGRRYVHMTTAQALADQGGAAALSIEPPIRAPFADGDAIEWAKPMIEGFLEGNSRDWTLSMARDVGLSFRVAEAA